MLTVYDESADKKSGGAEILTDLPSFSDENDSLPANELPDFSKDFEKPDNSPVLPPVSFERRDEDPGAENVTDIFKTNDGKKEGASGKSAKAPAKKPSQDKDPADADKKAPAKGKDPKEAKGAKSAGEAKDGKSGKNGRDSRLTGAVTSSQLDKNNKAKTVFIVSVCLLSPFLLILALAVLLVFAASFAVLVLAAGILSIALAALVIGGVGLALVGIIYGAICILTGKGFTVVTGVYELGLGLAITGITIILAALLYVAITALIPFLMKKLWEFFKFVVRKVKELAVRIYRKSTGTEI